MKTVLPRSLRATVWKAGNLICAFWIFGLAAALAAPADASAADRSRRPNIVIILGDDMGFSDMGSFGGEIRTPNLDSLANEGVRFTNFYTHASCSPTRSMLLSGVDTHVNGLGNMDEWTAPNQRGVPGYEGYLNTPGAHAAPTPQGCRLSHLHGRQVAPGQGAGADSGRARIRARLFAARRGGQLLGHDEFHRRSRRSRSSPRTGVISPSCPRTTTRPRPTPTS